MPDPDLTTETGVVELMESSATAVEWDDNADRVKAANDGYPEFWYRAIILSGLGERVAARWGGSGRIEIKIFGPARL